MSDKITMVDLFGQYKKIKKDNLISYYRNKDKMDNMSRSSIPINNTVKCPVCNSPNVEHISTLNRTVSVATFGIASSKIGKQYKCKNCKHMW